MSDVPEEWVTAGARALEKTYGPSVSSRADAQDVLTAVLPLICATLVQELKADLRDQSVLPGNMSHAHNAAVRYHIALIQEVLGLG